MQMAAMLSFAKKEKKKKNPSTSAIKPPQWSTVFDKMHDWAVMRAFCT